MENLLIKFIKSKPKIIKKGSFLLGEITIDDFYEAFHAPLTWWKKEDYESQWCTGIERLKNYDKSCLVTKFCNPDGLGLIDWWLLYKDSGMIYIRNQIIFPEFYEEVIGKNKFTPQNCYDFIQPKGPRELEDGRKLSEWVIPYE